MKKVILIIPFIFAFLFVTGLLVYLNSIYNNIFHFDFSPRLDNQLLSSIDSLAVKDSTMIVTKSDTTLATIEKNSTDISGVSGYTNEINTSKSQVNIDSSLKFNKQKSSTDKFVERTDKDSAYTVWLKKTAKLIENLSPAQASKLLKNYSDNQARDIIYTMKQRQAAKIISYLEPEYVEKITRFQ